MWTILQSKKTFYYYFLFLFYLFIYYKLKTQPWLKAIPTPLCENTTFHISRNVPWIELRNQTFSAWSGHSEMSSHTTQGGASKIYAFHIVKGFPREAVTCFPLRPHTSKLCLSAIPRCAAVLHKAQQPKSMLLTTVGCLHFRSREFPPLSHVKSSISLTRWFPTECSSNTRVPF